jgi:hypothetical protein
MFLYNESLLKNKAFNMGCFYCPFLPAPVVFAVVPVVIFVVELLVAVPEAIFVVELLVAVPGAIFVVELFVVVAVVPVVAS